MDQMATVLWALISKKFAAFFAGFFGAVVSLKFAQGLTVRSGAITVFCGGVSAHFLTGMTAKYFNLMEYQDAISFTIGLLGLNIFAAIIKACNEADLWQFIKSKWGDK
jgi:hypothetical protein